MSGSKPTYVFIGGTSEPGGLHVHTVDVAMAAATAGCRAVILCNSVDHFSAMIPDQQVAVQMIPQRAQEESSVLYWRRMLGRYRRACAVLCRGKLAEGSAGDLIGIRLATRRLYTIEHRAVDNPSLTPDYLRRHGRVMKLTVKSSVAVSDEIGQAAIQQLGLPPPMVKTCLNWVDPTFAHADDEKRRDAKIRLGLDPRTNVIGYHGRLAPEKRVDDLIEAFAALRNERSTGWKLVVVGDGWKRKELEQQVAERGIGDNVLFTGWHPDPSGAIAAFDISVLPSLAEGFPLGLMEAMAVGSACLAHPMSSTESLMVDRHNGRLADLGNPSVFTAVLREMTALDDGARRQFGTRASETIDRHHSRQRRLPDVLAALGIENRDAARSLPARPRSLVFTR